MYSNSNSFLGGSTSGRPGQQQYGQQSFQQPAPFGAQQTGFGGGQMQPQYTGMPLQSQATGFAPQQQQQQQSFGGQQMPQYTGYQPQQQNQSFQQAPQQAAPQQQPFMTSQPTAPAQQPQPTGMTSAQMADSFRGSSAPAQPAPSVGGKRSNKIPNIRLSFITAQDQAKFEQLFKSAVGDGQALSGDKAKDLLLRSKLPGDALSQIWSVARYIHRVI